MKFLTPEEADALNPLPLGNKNKVRIAIEAMQPGDILYVEKADFTWKNRTPNTFCKRLEKHGKGKFEVTQIKGEGWVVKRLE